MRRPCFSPQASKHNKINSRTVRPHYPTRAGSLTGNLPTVTEDASIDCWKRSNRKSFIDKEYGIFDRDRRVFLRTLVAAALTAVKVVTKPILR